MHTLHKPYLVFKSVHFHRHPVIPSILPAFINLTFDLYYKDLALEVLQVIYLVDVRCYLYITAENVIALCKTCNYFSIFSV